MKIITEPCVYLLASPQINQDALTEFLDAEKVGNWSTDAKTDAEALVEVAGRVCYMSFAKPRPGGNHAYIEHILEVGHGSVLEHANFSLLITGVSRSLTHELVRHRAGFSYSQLSQRFVDESDCNFVAPPAYIGDDELMQELECVALKVMQSYEASANWIERRSDDIEDKTLRRKRAREAARSVLPNCTETKIVVTGNARAWRHFLELRGTIHADAEIRRLALAVLEVLQGAAPAIFGDFTIANGCIEAKNRKV